MKRYLALAFALLILVSCSEGDADAPSAGSSALETNEIERGDKKKTPAADIAEDADSNNKLTRKKRQGGGTEDGGVAASGESQGSNNGAGPGRNAFDDSGSGDASSAGYPAPGDYVYAQSGFEKFCAGGSCERQLLPKRQNVGIALSERSAQGATLITEVSSSDDRMLRTTTDYGRAGALITDVYTRLSYQGFAFENEYHPAPPVESLRFPLRDGAAWRGSWKDSTSGSYQVRVFGPTRVTVGGRAVRAFQVATTTQFRGELNGEAKTLASIDPATKAVVKLSGSADLNSTYGRYVTEFSTSLRSGPRY